jgi:LuxR family transcriptional regulator, quorum-sensing system regulator BjaR1
LTGLGATLFASIENLDRAGGVQAILAVMEPTLASFGIEYFTFQDFPDPEKYEDFVFCKRVPDEWLKLYIKEKYNRIDPAFRVCRRAIEPFFWADAPYDAEREPATVEFVRRVADFGLDKGMMVTIPRVAGRPGVVWFGGSRPDLNARTLPALHLLALYAFERVRKFRPPKCDRKPLLTRRELEILAWVAAGKTAWEIGEILNIAKRTVDEHAQAAIRRLGTTNRTHAVALAIRDHLIELP